MKRENKITVNNLMYALLFFVFGVILLTSTDSLISIASKVIGIVLVVVGLIKTIVYIYMKGKLGNYSLLELVLGLLIMCCGGMLIAYSGVLSFAIRIIIGLWVLFAGINRIILAISVKSIDTTGFKVYLITSILMIIAICASLNGQIVFLLHLVCAFNELGQTFAEHYEDQGNQQYAGAA